jgi:hypothetical protein
MAVPVRAVFAEGVTAHRAGEPYEAQEHGGVLRGERAHEPTAQEAHPPSGT